MSNGFNDVSSVFNNLENSMNKSGFTSSRVTGDKLRGKQILDGFPELIQNLKLLPNMLTVRVARSLAAVTVDLLANSLPRVPYDTGELRKSGRATVSVGSRTYVVGKGQKDGTVLGDITKITSKSFKGAKNLNAEVSFNRTNDKGEDVALMMHEDILPHDARPTSYPAARKPGTGPKYLEIPWNEKRLFYENALGYDLIHRYEQDIQMASHVKKRKQTGTTIVDVVELVQSRIRDYGYY